MARSRGRGRGRGQGCARKQPLVTIGSSVGTRIVTPELTPELDLANELAKNAKAITPETGSLSNGTGTRRKLQLNTPYNEAIEDVMENLQQINGTIAKEAVKDDGKDEKADEPWVNMFKKNKNAGNGMALEYITSQFVEGKKVVQLEKEDVEREIAYSINYRALILKKWSPDFDFSKEFPTDIPLCVKLPH
ncbi:hypothetical protein KY285_008038 [Solanum tuberosum]|nr:hypothetical protein KY285_008038 [Solanum tuberosum]